MAAGDVAVSIITPYAREGAYFDAVDDFITETHDVKYLGINLVKGFTISCWIYNRIAQTSYIFDKSTGAGGAGGFCFRTYTLDRVGINLNNSADTVSANSALPLLTWTHTLITVTSAGLKTIYVNGVLSGIPATNDEIANITTTNNQFIGKSTGAFNPMAATISDLKMWNRVLTLDEITKEAGGISVRDSLIMNHVLADYTGLTNSGTRIARVEQTLAAAIKAARGAATDSHLLEDTGNGKQVVYTNIRNA